MKSPFTEPLDLQEQPFLRYLRLLDDGLEAGSVVLTADEPFGVWELNLVTDNLANAGDDDLEELEGFAESLSQLILFAFNEAPDDAIADWARNFEADPDLAVTRVMLIRKNMPYLERLWGAKTHARFPILTGIRADTVQFGSGKTHGLIRMSSNENLHGAFTGDSRQSFTMEVWPDDLARLIEEFRKLRDEIVNSSSGTERKGEVE